MEEKQSRSSWLGKRSSTGEQGRDSWLVTSVAAPSCCPGDPWVGRHRSGATLALAAALTEFTKNIAMPCSVLGCLPPGVAQAVGGGAVLGEVAGPGIPRSLYTVQCIRMDRANNRL